MTQLTRRRFVATTAALLAVAGGGVITGFETAQDGAPAQTAPASGGAAVPPTPSATGTRTPPRNQSTGHPDGAGGRVGVLVGDDGLFMVDASYLPVTDKLVAAIRTFSPSPFRYLVNTHSHPDHTGGNPNIVKQGALLLAREVVREQLLQPLPAAAGDAASRTDPARLPVVNYGYPFVDPTNGGTFAGVLEALEVTMQLAGPDTRLVPGHGTLVNRTDLAPYRDMILDVQTRVQQLIDAGKDQQEVLHAKLTAPYDASVAGALDLALGVTTADRFVSTL